VGRGQGALGVLNRCLPLLSCPVCGGTLGVADTSLRCARRHTFDRARAGYYDLLPPGHGRTAIPGDVRTMVEARRRFLGRGHFDSISDTVIDLALRTPPAVVLDAGCGEGWYLSRLMRAHEAPTDACFIGLDISRDALRLAARTHRDALFLVNDVGHRLCVADASVDVLLNIFAPRNEHEFARVLRPGAALIVVMPADDHLRELRALVPLLGIQHDKRERTLARFDTAFEVGAQQEVRYATSLTPDDVRDVVHMGPSHWHVTSDFQADALRVTVAVDVMMLRRI
jgi:23S rRNA (guanine745-N1)-methyltransferase